LIQLHVFLLPDIVGIEHYNTAQRVKEILQRYKELQDIIAILGMDELSEEDKLSCSQGTKGAAFPIAAVLCCYTVYRGSRRFVSIEDTIKGFKMIMNGEVDEYPEMAFSMVGTIEEAIEKGKKMIEEAK
jgi:F-type H+-transporting ATPase subunit beta